MERERTQDGMFVVWVQRCSTQSSHLISSHPIPSHPILLVSHQHTTPYQRDEMDITAYHTALFCTALHQTRSGQQSNYTNIPRLLLHRVFLSCLVCLVLSHLVSSRYLVLYSTNTILYCLLASCLAAQLCAAVVRSRLTAPLKKRRDETTLHRINESR